MCLTLRETRQVNQPRVLDDSLATNTIPNGGNRIWQDYRRKSHQRQTVLLLAAHFGVQSVSTVGSSVTAH